MNPRARLAEVRRLATIAYDSAFVLNTQISDLLDENNQMIGSEYTMWYSWYGSIGCREAWVPLTPEALQRYIELGDEVRRRANIPLNPCCRNGSCTNPLNKSH